jgi:hypothetical protein
MLFNDYTSVPSWQACRDRHMMLTSILDGGFFGLTVAVLNTIQGPTSSISPPYNVSRIVYGLPALLVSRMTLTDMIWPRHVPFCTSASR